MLNLKFLLNIKGAITVTLILSLLIAGSALAQDPPEETPVEVIVEEVAPAAEEVAPAAEEVAPAAEEVAPAAEEEAAPAAEEVAPAVEEEAPAVEEAAPAAEEVAPAVEEVAPAVEEAAPAAEEEAAPAEESVLEDVAETAEVGAVVVEAAAEEVEVVVVEDEASTPLEELPVEEAAEALAGGDPFGTLDDGVAAGFGLAAGAQFFYLPATVANPNGTCDNNVGANTRTCYWDAPIQQAVNDAKNGTTITIEAGTYEEQVVVDNKNLTLQGQPGTTIQAPTTLANQFTTAPNQNKPIITAINNATLNIINLVIDGLGRGNGNYRFDGVAFYNAGGSVQNSTIHGIRETPLNGNQHGVGIYANNADGSPRTLDILNNNIYDYQKNGMALSGNGLTVNVDGNTVTGSGPLGAGMPAQNGIQVGYGATGSITNNTVTGNLYTPGTWASAGILAYQAGGTLDISGNTITDNQTGMYIQDTNANVGNNTINNNWNGITEYQSVPGSNTVNITGNSITGNTPWDGIYTNSNTGTISGNSFSGNSNAIWYDGTGSLNAQNNYFGCPGGPGTPGCDSIGGSGAASVDTSNFLSNDPLAPAGGAAGFAGADAPASPPAALFDTGLFKAFCQSNGNVDFFDFSTGQGVSIFQLLFQQRSSFANAFSPAQILSGQPGALLGNFPAVNGLTVNVFLNAERVWVVQFMLNGQVIAEGSFPAAACQPA